MKRTSVSISKNLHLDVRRYATKKGMRIDGIVERALAAYIYDGTIQPSEKIITGSDMDDLIRKRNPDWRPV